MLGEVEGITRRTASAVGEDPGASTASGSASTSRLWRFATCHRSRFGSIHGQRRIWLAMKVDELAALNANLSRQQLQEAAP